MWRSAGGTCTRIPAYNRLVPIFAPRLALRPKYNLSSALAPLQPQSQIGSVAAQPPEARHFTLACRPVEIERMRGIGRVDARRQKTREQPGERLQQREEQQRQDNVEAGVKIGDGAAGIGLDCDQRRADPIEKSERQRAADDAIDHIADRQTLGAGSPPTPLSSRGLIAVPRFVR
jgi:hypothetical protein